MATNLIPTQQLSRRQDGKQIFQFRKFGEKKTRFKQSKGLRTPGSILLENIGNRFSHTPRVPLVKCVPNLVEKSDQIVEKLFD